MQRGIVPATKGLSQPNDMINHNLPLHLAHKDTKIERGDILAVSATGWGGVCWNVEIKYTLSSDYMYY